MPRCRSAACRSIREKLKHLRTRFTEQSLLTILHLFYEMVAIQARYFLTSRGIAAKMKASHDIFAGKLLRQSLESLKGFLLALEIHAGILQLIVEIGLCHGPKVMTLTSVLDIGYQLCSRRVSWKIADLEKRKITKNK